MAPAVRADHIILLDIDIVTAQRELTGFIVIYVILCSLIILSSFDQIKKSFPSFGGWSEGGYVLLPSLYLNHQPLPVVFLHHTSPGATY